MDPLFLFPGLENEAISLQLAEPGPALGKTTREMGKQSPLRAICPGFFSSLQLPACFPLIFLSSCFLCFLCGFSCDQ